MEQISLFKLLVVGIPEQVMCLIIGLVLCRNDVNKNWKKFIFKMTISVIIILLEIFFVRRMFNSFILYSIILVLSYIVVFVVIWKMNYRQSILAGCSTIFLLASVDIITLPLYTKFCERLNASNVFEGTILFSPFLRLVHLIPFLIFQKWNLRNNELISVNWREQNKTSKVAIVTIIALLFWCMVSLMNYLELYLKIIYNEENSSFLGINISLMFWMILLFFIFLLILLYYIFSFLSTHKMLDISLEEILNTVGEELSKEEISNCIDFLQQKYKKKGGI